jgi:hypothetical protein
MALPAIGITIKEMLNFAHDGAYDTVMENFWLLNLMCLLITGYQMIAAMYALTNMNLSFLV